jgi:hypothetical protein
LRINSATAGTAITPVTITNAGLISYYSISPFVFHVQKIMIKKYTVTFKKNCQGLLCILKKKSKNRATLADKSH